MRTDIPTALQTHLDTRETTLCWCWQIVRRDGVTMGFTNHDRDLTFDSVTYEASTGFLGTEIESQLGMNVDNMDVYGAVDSANITESDIEAGRYDNADVLVYLVNWQDVSQRVVMKKGNIGNVKRGQTLFEAEVRGISHEMQQVQGRLYSYKDTRPIEESGIDLTTSQYTGNGTVAGTNGSSTIVASGISSYASNWFTYGLITFTSGANNGLSKEVKTHLNSNGVVTVTLWEPMPFTIAVTDTFDIRAGYDGTFAQAKSKFNMAADFRGFPHVPGPSTVQIYASTGDPNMDGGGNFVGKD